MGTGFLPPELMRLTLAHGTESIPASECEEETRVGSAGWRRNYLEPASQYLYLTSSNLAFGLKGPCPG